MRARDAVGKRITRVQQYRFWDDSEQRQKVGLEFIELEDGTRLYPVTDETSTDYHTHLIVGKP